MEPTWSDGTMGRTTRYMRDPLYALKQQISALEEDDGFTLRPVPKPQRPDGTTYQSTPMETSHFHNVYSSL